MIGQKLGPYEITEEIGKGGMATVYRAYHNNMDRFVAIKIIRRSILNEKTIRARFQREARLIARLEHPHLLPVYDFDGEADPPFIVMRFLEGGTLRQVMDASELPQGEILYMLRQISAALDYAHRQGIVHRDLKPSNIMIDKEGNAFVADFGIARAENLQGEHLTETGAAIGTPAYMSPEQARSEPDLDHLTDIYSLAVIIFELLTGQHPFPKNSPLETLMAHLQEPPPDICSVKTGLPEALNPIFHAALAKERGERYPSASALVEAVGAALQTEVSSSPARLREMTGVFAAGQLAALAQSAGESDSGTTASQDRQRQLTAVYLDLTEWAEILYAEHDEQTTVKAQLDALWERFDRIAGAYSGQIHSRTDEVGVALWGLEATSEIDPEQALRAVLDMKAAVLEEARSLWGSDYEGNEDEPLPFAAGVTTGPVLLEMDGANRTLNATGPTITMANKLKDLAPPGEVMVSHDTYTHVRGVFDFLASTPVRIRGRSSLLDVYIAQRARPRAFRSQARGIEGVEVRMIGREIELRILQNALNLTIEDRETQVVTVVGDAGVGKSRLLHEFFNWMDLLEERLWFFEARATQPSQLQPFSLTRDLFSFRFQIADNDPLPVVRQKFIDGVADFMGEGSAARARLIGQLVGFDFTDDADVEAALKEPDLFQARALAYLGEFFRTASKANPVYIQVEDIHWADDRSLDLLSSLTRENQQLPLFVIYMARPSLYERRPSWGEGELYHHRVQLEPLARLDARLLVKELLKKAAEVPTELRDTIIDRAEGNPFYIEELIKALIDDGVIRKGDEEWTIDMSQFSEMRIPQTLTGLLQSRLDAIDPAQRALMQRASVVGRVFWESAATYLSQQDGVQTATTVDLLEGLREREMVLKREDSNFEGTAEYVFRHAILRDVTYESIVPQQRRGYHRLVAEWLAAVAGDRIDEYTSLVAEHYQAAGELALAADQFLQAGERISRLGTVEEALKILQRGMRLVDGEAHTGLRSEIGLATGKLTTQTGRVEEGIAMSEAALAAARESGREDVQIKALLELSWQAQLKPALDRAIELASEALGLAEKNGDERQKIQAMRRLATTFSEKGDIATGDRYSQRALEAARAFGDSELLVQCLLARGLVLSKQKKSEELVLHLEEGLEIAREMRDRPLLLSLVNNLGDNHLQRGAYAEAVPYFEEAVQIGRDRGGAVNVVLPLGNLALALAGTGQIERTKQVLKEDVRVARESNYDVALVIPPVAYAQLLGGLGQAERGLQVLAFLETLESGGFMDADIERVRGILAEGLGEGEVGAAEARAVELEIEGVLEEILGL